MMVSDCEKCGEDSGVYDTRPSVKGFIIRQRKCVACGLRWTTYEVRESVEFRDALATLASYFPKPEVRRPRKPGAAE